MIRRSGPGVRRQRRRRHKDGGDGDGDGDNGNEGNDDDDDTYRRKEGGERTRPQNQWSNNIESNNGWPNFGAN